MREKVVSVLMPSLNSGLFMHEAIKSCLDQNELLELIIIDGGSSEETKSIIRYWGNKDIRVKYFFENDEGPADALNKALSYSTGDYIGWLNSDDRYEKNALKRSLKKLYENKKLKIVYGHGQHIDELGRFTEYYPTLKPEKGIKKFQDGCFICQPTILMKKELFKDIGSFDKNLKTCFDFDLWLRVFQKYNLQEIGFINAVQASTRLHKNTITNEKYWLVNIESAYLLFKYLGYVENHWLEQAARFLVLKNKSNAKQYLENSEFKYLLNKEIQIIYEKFLDSFINKIKKPIKSNIYQRKELPKSILILLNHREDLQDCGFNLLKNERNLCIWLIKHGTIEYPFLFKGNYKNNSLIKWLSNKNDKNNSRIVQAIWDSNENLQKFWVFKKNKTILKIFLYFFWSNFCESKIIQYKSFFKPIHINLFKLIDNKTKKIFWLEKRLISLDQVNLIGYSNFESGVGHDLKTTSESLELFGFKTNIIDFQTKLNSRKILTKSRRLNNKNNAKITIICLNPFDCYWILSLKLTDYLESNYLIGYLPWELKKWPVELKEIFNYLDEIWTPSKFILDSLTGFEKYKKIMPLCVEYNSIELEPKNKIKKAFYRNKYKVNKENVIFLCSFDLESYVERKNPWGAIKAFQKAFNPNYPNSPENKKVNLIIKTFKPLCK